ncbi:MAG: nucleoside hydrolase [Clostridia bacterium]|nr:nucleoside hydrolase [Clostridia bacterium]
MKNKKIKVIIDTDPGVDDTAGLLLALYDKRLDIQLITTVVGNVKLKTATRNALHILDKFNIDIPVAMGAEKAMQRTSPTAEHVHKKEGMGGYIPPKTTNRQVIEEDAVEAMYRVLKEGNGDIELLVLGPHTNVGTLFQKHPDIISKVPRVVFMGGSPFGIPGFPDHISFNISSDPEAFQIVLDSKLPLVMVPSNIGRRKAHLTEEIVLGIKERNDVGAFLFEMFDQYWERGFPDKRIATNDTCAYMYMVYPELFKIEQADIVVDCDKEPGKTFAHFNKKGQVSVVVDVKRKKFLKLIAKMIKSFDKIKFN